jgi:hypothetical protein
MKARAACPAICAAALLIAACGRGTPPAGTPGVPPAPSGYRLQQAVPGLSPRLGRLLDTPRTTPMSATLAVYVAETGESTVTQGVAAQPAITLTLASYPDPSGALAAYNAWFAELGFMPAAERVPLDLGEQAERFDVGWPPLHAVIARAGPRFVIAEAGEGVPAEQRGAILEDLVRSTLASP